MCVCRSSSSPAPLIPRVLLVLPGLDLGTHSHPELSTTPFPTCPGGGPLPGYSLSLHCGPVPSGFHADCDRSIRLVVKPQASSGRAIRSILRGCCPPLPKSHPAHCLRSALTLATSPEPLCRWRQGRACPPAWPPLHTHLRPGHRASWASVPCPRIPTLLAY